MPHAPFVHLRVHTAYSLAEGAIKVEELVKLCVAQHMPAVAVTDTGNLFGAMEFATAAAKAGVQPIVGCQIAMTREDQQPGARPLKPDALVVLAQSAAGYRNLMRLVSRAFLETEPGLDAQLPWSALEGATDGLLALTAGPAGIAGRLLVAGQDKAATVAMDRLRRLFPERLYVELARQGVPDQVAIEPGLLDMADRWSLPLVATNEAFFAAEEMYDAHDALLCIAAGSYVSESARPRVSRDHRFKTAAEMTALFADVPEATANTIAIAKRCGFMPVKHKPILPAYGTAATRTEEEELKAQAEEGLEERLRAAVLKDDTAPDAREAAAKPYRERLAFELTVIQRMGYGGYFLIVADFIKWAKANGIPVGPGRGSGAGSVVAWALTITDLDPLRFGLLFERFLNPERVSMPDFDVDFCQERRDEVIAYVRDKYGADRVAHIITFGKLQARAVLRDVGRVLQMPFGQVDRICKMVPNNPANPVTLQKAIDDEPRLQQLRDEDESVAHLLKLGLKLEGLYRNASTHAAGVVIGDRPLAELVPLYRDPRAAMPATQFNMKWVEEAGLVKFDFLGLKTLTVLVRTVELLKARGVEIDLSHLPLDDAKSFEMLGRAEVTGVFQMESTGMRDVLRRLRPDRFEDLIAVVALYRPGPMGNIPSYIARKHGKEKPDYIYPGLEAVLAETYGIIIYQEQVMQIAQILAGYSLGKADLLRRAMGKKDKKAMEAEKVPFVAACVEQGVPETRAKEIFDLIEVFAGYGFNKSHAAAYALVAYQTAYLKANYPVEFMAASMTFDVGNTDKLNVFKGECDRLGIPLLPPDVNRSRPDFSVEALSGGR
ncbi:MAG: DNA polymerase III subunit alpha, partial [Alphaproteobacteria bacterium]|nr:DNA polymerase III subunit alpha [Alphaproteobacteria bacterium]